jgi:ferrous-iron efflux pump FieF
MAAAAAPLVRLLRSRQRGAVATAHLMSLLNDELGLLAALAGTFLVERGIPGADPIATLIVATVIAISAVGLFRRQSVLPDRALAPSAIPGGTSRPRSLDQRHIGSPRHSGPVHRTRSRPCRVAHRGPAGAVHSRGGPIAEQVRERIHAGSDPGYCLIHVEPAGSAEYHNGRSVGTLAVV